MNCLAIESAGLSCSVALLSGGEIRQRFSLAARRHGELILPWADELLAECGIARTQLDAIALSRGPGSFTSLRLGLSAGLAIAFALDRPVHAISSLAALAKTALTEYASAERTSFADDSPELRPVSHVYALMDARMGELYAARYRVNGGDLTLLDEEMLLKPEDCPAPSDNACWIGAGNGFELLPAGLFQAQMLQIASHLWPTAKAMLELLPQSQPMAADAFSPVYLRDRVAEPPAAPGVPQHIV